MARMKIEDLREGMVVSKPLYSKEGTQLVRARHILTDRVIARLLRWGIPVVEVEAHTIH